MQKQDIPTYLKAITIRDPSDLHSIAEDIKKGMILILRVTPLAQKDFIISFVRPEAFKQSIQCFSSMTPHRLVIDHQRLCFPNAPILTF